MGISVFSILKILLFGLALQVGSDGHDYQTHGYKAYELVGQSSHLHQDLHTHDQFDSRTGVPSAGLIIAIDADELMADSLAHSWNCIDEPYENRQIRSRPLVKSNLKIVTAPSFDGASLRIQGTGSSIGESQAAGRGAEVMADTVTEFKIGQQLFLNFNGMTWNAPQMDVRTRQSFIRAKSTKPLGGVFAKMPYHRFPETVQRKSEIFARQKLSEQLTRTLHQGNVALQQQIAQFSQRRPDIAALDWQMSSDQKGVYLAAGHGEYFMPLPPMQRPVEMFLHEQMLTQEVNWRLSNRTFTSQQIGESLGGMGMGGSEPVEEDWSIAFLDRAIDIKLHDGKLDVRMGFDRFEHGERVISKFAIRFIYKFFQHNGGLYLLRDGDLEIQGQNSGARSRVIRSVLRKRISSVLPKTMPLRGLTLEENPLVLENIESSNSVLHVLLGIK